MTIRIRLLLGIKTLWSTKGFIFFFKPLGNSSNTFLGLTLLLLVLPFFVGCKGDNPEALMSSSQKYLDSLEYYLDSDTFKVTESMDKEVITKRISDYLIKMPEDSIRIKAFFGLSYFYYTTNDSLNFRRWNKKSLELSHKLNDSSKIAESHWDLGNFFSRRHLVDSTFYHYNKAYNTYNKIGEEYYAARMLLNLAIIKSHIKDFTGSEISTIKAINVFKPIAKHRQLYLSFNNLGIIYNELEEYEKAIYYHQKALEYQKFLSGQNTFYETSLNNIGVVYQNKGDYDNAEKQFLKALNSPNLSVHNIRLYAMVLDNLAYAKLSREDTSGIKKMFEESLAIRDSIDHISGLITSYVHIAEYYGHKQQPLRAKQLLEKAKRMAAETNSNRDLLEISLLLSEIDTINKGMYLEDYIHLNDSLHKKERAVRNKFARIEFETDQFIAENQYLNQQRKWIVGGAGGAIFMFLLIFIIWRQKSQNKKLELEKAQQNANEEIYNLLLAQQNKLEEGRHQEKERISKELHDGVLGKLFGTRLMLENLYGKSDLKSLESKKKYLNDLRLIEEEVRAISHELNAELFSPKQSFLDVLQEYLAEQKEIGKFELLFVNDQQISWDELSSEIKINLFRIIQEVVTNINKHANANLVTITCNKYEGWIEIVICDNGEGFEVNEKRKGIGLQNMESRVTRLSGHFKISSGEDGTQIELEIPIKRYE